MKRHQAIRLLGGTVPSAASTLEVSFQAVMKWPPELPRRISDRVLGAYMRKNMPGLVEGLLRDPAPVNDSAASAPRAAA